MDNWAQIRVLRAEEGDLLCGSAIRFLVLFSDIGRPSWLSFLHLGSRGGSGRVSITPYSVSSVSNHIIPLARRGLVSSLVS